MLAVENSFVLYHSLYLRSESAFGNANVTVGMIEPLEEIENTTKQRLDRFRVGDQVFVVWVDLVPDYLSWHPMVGHAGIADAFAHTPWRCNSAVEVITE